MNYSQNNEQEFILNYFADRKGHLLDIGANDGITLSNSRALIERGWSADLVEPAPIAFDKLSNLYLDRADIMLHKVAVGDKVGKVKFYDSGTIFAGEDTSLVSTTCEADYTKWKGATEYTETEVYMIDVPTLFGNCLGNTFEFITIDAEGMDLLILQQIDLKEVKNEMIIVEHNGVETEKYIEYISAFGHKLLHKNAENVIMAL